MKEVLVKLNPVYQWLICSHKGQAHSTSPSLFWETDATKVVRSYEWDMGQGVRRRYPAPYRRPERKRAVCRGSLNSSPLPETRRSIVWHSRLRNSQGLEYGTLEGRQHLANGSLNTKRRQKGSPLGYSQSTSVQKPNPGTIRKNARGIQCKAPSNTDGI